MVEAEDLALLRAGEGLPRGGFSFLGEYVPKGWKRTENTYFVDASGFGQEGEPALTFSQFLDKVIPGRGYAVVQAGQFQVYVGEYIPTPTNGHRKRRSEPLPAALADELAGLLAEALVADLLQCPNGANHGLPAGE